MHTTIPFIDRMDLETAKIIVNICQNLQNRSLIVDAHAFGSFRKDLIKNRLRKNKRIYVPLWMGYGNEGRKRM